VQPAAGRPARTREDQRDLMAGSEQARERLLRKWRSAGED
jgi:hypothetical protein